MVRIHKQAVWSLAAWAVLVAPAIPRECGCPCAEPSGSCHQPCCAAETADATCRCQLDARNDQPLASAKGLAPSFDHQDQAFAPTAFGIDVPRNLGISREYLAASLAVPIRPARILFGVWRN